MNTFEQRMPDLPMFLLHESGLHVAVVAQLSVLDEVILRSPKRNKKNRLNSCQKETIYNDSYAVLQLVFRIRISGSRRAKLK
jgi:hypothetical protein